MTVSAADLGQLPYLSPKSLTETHTEVSRSCSAESPTKGKSPASKSRCGAGKSTGTEKTSNCVGTLALMGMCELGYQKTIYLTEDHTLSDAISQLGRAGIFLPIRLSRSSISLQASKS